MAENFDQWCIVELFGHQQIAGKVTEQTIGGQGFIRVDVPPVAEQEGFTKLYGAGAIYAITPTTEDVVRAYVSQNARPPIQPYMLDLKQLSAGRAVVDEFKDTDVPF